MSNTFFHFKQFSILHQAKGLKVNTDACLLGAVARHPSAQSVLDIGTGTGVVALMLAQKYPDASITAIELVNEVYLQAKANIDASKFKNIEIIHKDFLDNGFDGRFDLIVCNPPYFSDHLQKNASSINTAIHNLTLDHQLLLKKVSEIMDAHGSFFMILPTELMSARIELASQYGLQVQTILDIQNKPGKAYRTITEFKLKLEKDLEKTQLQITTNQGEKSASYQALMSPYYLDDTKSFKNIKK